MGIDTVRLAHATRAEAARQMNEHIASFVAEFKQCVPEADNHIAKVIATREVRR